MIARHFVSYRIYACESKSVLRIVCRVHMLFRLRVAKSPSQYARTKSGTCGTIHAIKFQLILEIRIAVAAYSYSCLFSIYICMFCWCLSSEL